MKKKILVISGGSSKERAISLDTGKQVARELSRNKYKVKIIKKPLYELNMENNISSLYRKEQEYYAKCVRKDITPV